MKFALVPLSYWIVIEPAGENVTNSGMIIPKSVQKNEFLLWRVTGVGHLVGVNAEGVNVHVVSVGDYVLAEEQHVRHFEYRGQSFYSVDETQVVRLVKTEDGKPDVIPLPKWVQVEQVEPSSKIDEVMVTATGSKKDVELYKVIKLGDMAGMNNSCACDHSLKPDDLVFCEKRMVNRIEYEGSVFYIVDEEQAIKLTVIEV